MRIGEVAEQAGVDRATIRFYERLGVLPRPAREAGNGYREYQAHDLRRIELVAALRRLDVPLGDIRSLAGSCFDHRCAAGNRDLLAVIERRSAEVQARIDELHDLAARFAQLKRRLSAENTEGRSVMAVDLETQPAERVVQWTPEAPRDEACGCGCTGSGCDCGCDCCGPAGTHTAHRQALEVLAQPATDACDCGCCG